MASVTEKLSVILELVTGNYKAEAKAAANATAGIGTAAKSAGGGLEGVKKGFDSIKAGIAAVGIKKVVDELWDMANAAAEDAKSQDILANALRNNTGATDDQIAANERWITTMQVATQTADTDLRQAVTNLTVAGRGLEEAQGDIAIAIDIAATKGIALDSVIKGMVRSLASGSTAGLGRLGIETKNAAGEMLTYDEVLKNAAETMGGSAATAANTLAGAIERSRIVMEEAREEAGKSVVGPMVVLQGIWTEFQVALLGGDEQLAELNTTFNLLISQGINPMENALASAITVLKVMNEEDLSGGTLDTLIAMLGMTKDDVLELRSAILLSEDAFGLNNVAAAKLVTLLDDLVGNADPAVLATRRHQAAMEDAAGAARDYTSALKAQRDLVREMTDPVFALINANQRYEDAQRRITELTIDGQEGSREYEDALGDLLVAQLDLTAAQAEANIVGDDGLELLRQYAIQAGINMEAFDDWAQSVDNLAGSISSLPSSIGTVNTITGNPNRPGAFDTGGVVEGKLGEPVLVIAHAGETILPTHKPGFAKRAETFREYIERVMKEREKAGATPRNPGFMPGAMNHGLAFWNMMFNPDGTWKQRGRGGRPGLPRFDEGGVVGGHQLSYPAETIQAGSWQRPTQNISRSVSVSLEAPTGVTTTDLQYGAMLAQLMADGN